MTTLDTGDIEAITRELHECRQTQSWATAVRSSWTDELQAILDANEAGDDPAAAIEAADTKAWDLAEHVARTRLTSLEDFRSACTRLAEREDATDDVVDAIAEMATAADLVEFIRAQGWNWDDGSAGLRDGYTITDMQAEAYATRRDWREDRCEGVAIDLLDGSVTRW